MHSVDKWLEGNELTKDEVNRAITMREKTLQIIEKQQVEIDKLKTETVEALKKQITVVPADRTRKLNFCPECGADMRER